MSIKEFINVSKDYMIEDLGNLIRIPSIFAEDGSGKPFGAEVDKGLEEVLRQAAAMGMKTRNLDGYAGEITAGSGDYIVGILVHVDVVEAGENWNTEPFTPIVIDNKIFGRGSMDDKGPIVSSLYAMKYLMDNNKIPEGVALRMIVGTNEEEDWKGIEYYVNNTKILPNVSIVPDGYFPLIFCEKGLFDFDMVKDIKVDHSAPITVLGLSGGNSRNIVSAKAECTLAASKPLLDKIQEKAKAYGKIKASYIDDILYIKAEGRGTHAMSPEKGINANTILMDFLGSLEEKLSHQELIDFYNTYVGTGYNGENFGCCFEDEMSGKTTFNVGVINVEGSKVVLESNLRYPASMDKEVVLGAMKETMAKAGYKYTEKSYLQPICIDKYSDLVTKLMKSYKKVSGDFENQPFAIGGATYARAIPNAVAFGPLFPYEEELAHEANEFLSVDSFMKMTEIFADALELLMERDGEQ